MINKIRPPHWTLVCGFMALAGTAVNDAAAQTAPYPDPTAAAGMTSGLPNGSTSQQIEMARVRTEAQTAQGEAVAASMARSVDQTIESQNRERTLQSAREIKAIKRSMAERLKWDRANATQVNKVSSQEMSAWNTNNGNVRVERNVPDPFLAALIEEERIALENGTLEKPKKGFRPLQSTAAVLTSPFQMFSGGNDDYAAPVAASSSLPEAEADSSGGGFFSKLKVPSIGGRNEPVDIPNPATAEPQFVQTASSAPAPRVQPAVATTTPGTVPRISGAELVDGAAPVNQRVGNDSPNPYASESTGAPVMTESLPGDEPEKTGFFSRFKSDEPASSSSGGGGFFGFGKKKESSSGGGPAIDASLFPDGAVAQAPTGGNLSGGYSANDVAQEAQMAPSSTGSFELPGEEPEKKRSGFSIPKPSLSIPTIGGGGSSGDSVPTLTTINSAGNDYYVVTSTAQFMVYGDDQMNSEVRALPAGTVVRMTKPGDQWASVQLPGGASGIVQNKFLRGASGSEAGSQFAPAN